jgi:hypothetical protein
VKRRSRLGLLAVVLATPFILFAAFIGWSGIEANHAFSNGALDQPVWCVDRSLARQERMGRIEENTIARGLVAQVAKYEGEMGRHSMARWHLHSAGWYLAVTTFWSKDDRRRMFASIRAGMRRCR